MQLRSRVKRSLGPLKEAIHYCRNKVDKWGFSVQFIDDFIGYGVFAHRKFIKGEFLVEYCEELISHKEVLKREKMYPEEKDHFSTSLKVDGTVKCVDATNDAKTRVGRMINDSESNANAKMMVVQVERKPHLCLFAQKDIEENEEIRFDYGVADLPWRQMNPVYPARSSDSESICQTENPVDPARSSDSESICQTDNPVDPARSSDSEAICQAENPVDPARSSDSESICQTEVTNRTRTRIPKMANFLLDDDSSDDSCVSDWRPSYYDSDSDASEEIPLNVSGESALISSLPEVTTTSLDLVAANFWNHLFQQTLFKIRMLHLPPVASIKKTNRRCPFCDMKQTQLSRYIKLKHKDHQKVSGATKLPKSERDQMFASFKDAILKHNTKQAKEENPVYERERAQTTSSLIMCGLCNGFYSQTIFHRHKNRCQGESSRGACAVPLSLMSVEEEVGPKFRDNILAKFNDDAVGTICRSDQDIITIGKRLWKKTPRKQDKVIEVKKSVMCDMRRLSNLYLCFKSKLEQDQELSTQQGGSASNMFNRCHFRKLQEAIESYTTKEASSELKPGLKSGLYYLLLKSAKILKATYLMDGMDEKASEFDMFCEVFQLNKDFIFGDATIDALNRNRQENLRKPEALPLEADLKKIKAFTVDTISSMLSDCYKVWDSHAFKELRDLTVSRLTLFNARRGGEPSRLRISEWVDADNNSWISEDQIDKLDPIGKALVHTLKVAYQSGKGNNHLVPVLFPKDCLVSMRKLTDKVCRRQCGISEESMC
ncbi:hypothetical protein BSL78_12013 [Apostichopus japonicus]|uniref:SET domain-containing protein n=1 Tax=Stichopus japonicus TaxID=307972 RepID=A0A2G8KSX2_STIJA|nr:hypothetical protein BSL78_12013 [Apostichopus japonicus]